MRRVYSQRYDVVFCIRFSKIYFTGTIRMELNIINAESKRVGLEHSRNNKAEARYAYILNRAYSSQRDHLADVTHNHAHNKHDIWNLNK